MSDVQVLSDGTVVVLYTEQRVGGRNAATAKLTELSASLHVLRSTDGGDSLEPSVQIATLQSGYNAAHTRGVPARMAVDALSPRFRDRLYVVWTDISSGRGRIMSAHSSDAGKTWSQPIAVDDDVPAHGPNAGPDAFMPAVAVNRDGVVGVTWYDRRDNPDNQGYTVRFAASLDGGTTWLPSARVSTGANDRSQQKESF